MTAEASKLERLKARTRQFAATVGVGGLASAVDMLTLAMLVEWLHVRPQHANVPALLAGAAVQFIGCRHLLFRADGSTESSWRTQLPRFALVEVGTLALNALAFEALRRASVPYPIARLAGSALVFALFSYPLWKRVFTTPVRVSLPS